MENLPFILFLCAIIGVVLHNLLNLHKINQRNKGHVDFMKYYKLERFTILISLIVSGTAAFLVYEDIQAYVETTKYGKYIRIFFIVIGYFAQSMLVAVMGKAEPYIRKEDAKKEN